MTRAALGAVVLLAGLGGAGYAIYRSDGNPFTGAVEAVTTRHSDSGGGDASRAQQVQLLEGDRAELEEEIEAEENDIDAEFDRRMADNTFEGLSDRIESECAGEWGWFNPYGGCDDQIVEEAKAETRQWREQQVNERVRPLRKELARVEAELESLYLTA